MYKPNNIGITHYYPFSGKVYTNLNVIIYEISWFAYIVQICFHCIVLSWPTTNYESVKVCVVMMLFYELKAIFFFWFSRNQEI